MANMGRAAAAAAMVLTLIAAIGCPDPATDPPAGNASALSELVGSPPSPPANGEPRGKATVKFKEPERPAAVLAAAPTEKPEPESTDERQTPSGDAEPSQEVLFDGWETPQLAIVITGQQHGYIEPCGCTGLANQKGGMARRHTFLKQLRAKGWVVAPMDVGGQVRRPGPQAEAKYKWTTEALTQLGYKAVAYGLEDVVLSSGELAFPMLNAPESPYPFIGANVSVISSTPTHRVFEAGGLRVGVTAVLGDEFQKELANDNPGVELRSVDEGLKAAWKELEAAKCSFHVLVAHASVEESREIAKRHPHFKLVITTGLGEPERLPERIPLPNERMAWMVQAGNKAMYAGVVGVYDGAPSIRYQRVPLDDRFEDSPEMLKILASYQAELKERGLKQLGAVEVPHYSGNEFVGSAVCQDCHYDEHQVWSKTGHAHATDSIVNPVERAGIERHHDPECLSCHVTGWAPQEYTPYASGYLSLSQTPHLKQNGCENCHGPGSRHVDIENGEFEVSEAEQMAVRNKMRLPLARAKEHCVMCHDQDNSPDFFKPGAFEEYWKKIAH